MMKRRGLLVGFVIISLLMSGCLGALGGGASPDKFVKTDISSAIESLQVDRIVDLFYFEDEEMKDDIVEIADPILELVRDSGLSLSFKIVDAEGKTMTVTETDDEAIVEDFAIKIKVTLSEPNAKGLLVSVVDSFFEYVEEEELTFEDLVDDIEGLLGPADEETREILEALFDGDVTVEDLVEEYWDDLLEMLVDFGILETPAWPADNVLFDEVFEFDEEDNASIPLKKVNGNWKINLEEENIF